jgi:hypothetical protein
MLSATAPTGTTPVPPVVGMELLASTSERTQGNSSNGRLTDPGSVAGGVMGVDVAVVAGGDVVDPGDVVVAAVVVVVACVVGGANVVVVDAGVVGGADVVVVVATVVVLAGVVGGASVVVVAWVVGGASVVVVVAWVVGGASVVVTWVVAGANVVVEVDGTVIGGVGFSSIVNTLLSVNPDPCSTTSIFQVPAGASKTSRQMLPFSSAVKKPGP